jgi:hypothetical protein
MDQKVPGLGYAENGVPCVGWVNRLKFDVFSHEETLRAKPGLVLTGVLLRTAEHVPLEEQLDIVRRAYYAIHGPCVDTPDGRSWVERAVSGPLPREVG